MGDWPMTDPAIEVIVGGAMVEYAVVAYRHGSRRTVVVGGGDGGCRGDSSRTQPKSPHGWCCKF